MYNKRIIDAVIESRKVFTNDIRFSDNAFNRNENMDFHFIASLSIDEIDSSKETRLLLKKKKDLHRIVILDSSYNYIPDKGNGRYSFTHWFKSVKLNQEKKLKYRITLKNTITQKIIYEEEVMFYEILNCDKYQNEVFFRLFLYENPIEEFKKLKY